MVRAYSWLGEPGVPVEPMERIEGEWADIWAARLARGNVPLFPSVLHSHTPTCFAGVVEDLVLKWDGSGMWGQLDQTTGHWYPTRTATPQEVAAARAGVTEQQ